jgi:hypothetical protein
MKKSIGLFLFVLLPFLLPAQVNKYAILSDKNPIIGDWEWVKDPTSSPFAAVPDIEFVFLRFSAGTKSSFGAVSSDSTKGFGCATYFLAYSNGSTMIGTISDCCVVTDKGKKISFNYQYDPGMDELIIRVKDEQYFYRRKL